MKNLNQIICVAAMALLMAASFISCTGSDREDNEASPASAAALPEDRIAEVEVMALRPAVFSHEIVSNGRLQAREKVDVNFPSPGLISEICARNGQHVAKGQKIAVLDSYKLQNQLAKDRNAVASATLEMQDVIIGQGFDPDHLENVPAEVMRLARLRSGLQQAELALAATERDIQDATLVAPISGTIANLSAKPHNMSSASTPLCVIINESAMDVEFSILESELPMIKVGDAVEVTPFSGGGARQGRVAEINPMVGDDGMVKVWASISGGNGLIDGMNVRISVKRAVEQALVVPKSAVVLRSGRQVVFTLDGDKAIWNYVATGLENLNEFTIVEGLAPGSTVIVSGNVNLAHESPVKVK
ncbi:MAG: efflux RND transporter periplasmic adaptor subunit [Clostridium sp.]|nr:efflux RND transporter periplasmic adaptor subunit [Clostridium sp.]